MNQNLHFYILVFLVSFFCINCEKEKCLNCPEDLEPGRRDYIWTVDTLKANPWDLFYLFSLWGSSPTDIWATGSGGASDVTLWHYDGVSWTRDLSCLSSNMMCVFGFAQNDVWACDAPGRGVYHYNGTQWTNVYKYKDTGTLLGLNNIWGDAPNNIYVVGAIDFLNGDYKGVILHFNGSSWSYLSIPEYRVGFTSIKRGMLESDKYYLSAVCFESTGDTNKIFELDDTVLKEIYSGQDRTSINEMAGRIYHCIDKKIYKYHDNLLTIWKDFSSTKHLGRIWGRSELDFFTVSTDGLTHYDGTDLVTLFPTKSFINNIAVFEKDIFVLCDNKIIIHGKLK